MKKVLEIPFKRHTMHYVEFYSENPHSCIILAITVKYAQSFCLAKSTELFLQSLQLQQLSRNSTSTTQISINTKILQNAYSKYAFHEIKFQ